jgi:hypothetical protein
MVKVLQHNAMHNHAHERNLYSQSSCFLVHECKESKPGLAFGITALHIGMSRKLQVFQGNNGHQILINWVSSSEPNFTKFNTSYVG